MALNPLAERKTTPPRSSVGSSPPRSRSTRDLVAQVARDAVVESLRTELGAARRESLFASSELTEVREACRSEVQRYEQDKQRLTARLKSQKTRLDDVLIAECQVRRRCSQETEEKQKLELRLRDQDAAFQEERLRERNGARKQLEMLQQRCLEAAAAQVDLQNNCTKEMDAVEAVEVQAAQRQAALEMREKDMLEKASSMTIARKNSQAAFEASVHEEAILRSRLTCTEQELAEMSTKAVHADEETQRCAELRVELLHAVHHELPSERSRVSELEASQQAEAERIRGVCEAEVSDLPPNLLEKVQSAIRRHEAWLHQWSGGRSKSPGGKRESGFSDHRSGSALPDTSGVCPSLTSATTRYEAVLGALAQCAGAAARENTELKVRLATPTPEDHDQKLPEVQKQLTSMKREITKLREENRELQTQRQIQEDVVSRLRRDMVSVLPSKEEQPLHRPIRRCPGTDVHLHTEHRRNMKVLEAEMQTAERQAESLRGDLAQQEISHAEVVEGFQQEVLSLQARCRETDSLRRQLQTQEALVEDAKASQAKLSQSDTVFANRAQRAEMERRLAVISRRLGDLAGGKTGKVQAFAERELERELLRLCERLNHEVAAGRRERRSLAEDCRLKDIAIIESEHRCMDLESTLRQRDKRLQDVTEGITSLEERLESQRSINNGRIVDRTSEAAFDSSSHAHRLGARHQLDQRRRAAKESLELSGSAASKGSGSDRKPVAELLQRWVKGAIERQDGEITNSEVSSPSSSSKSPNPGPLADGVERKPVANLLQRWVTKALENEEDRASSESPTLPKPPVDRQPVQALLSRWVKKAVDSQEDDEFDTEPVEEGRELPLPQDDLRTRSSDEDRADTCADNWKLSEAETDSPGNRESEHSDGGFPRTPRSPSLRAGSACAGIDCGTPAAKEGVSPQDSNQSITSGSCADELLSGNTSPMQLRDPTTEGETTGGSQSSTWRTIDVEGTSDTVNWVGDLDDTPVLQDSELNKSVQRLPSVAEEHSPGGVEEDPEELALEVTFQNAEALCDAQSYNEALPIFQDLLVSLQGKTSPAMRSLEAEVRAHMGVTLQSLGRVEDAIEAYSSAVRQDSSLHVCHANLAQLYSYLEDPVRARLHLNTAMRLNPSNSMYISLDEQFKSTTSTLGLSRD